MADIMKVMEAAKEIMRSSGNMHQWGEGYPSETIIGADMAKNGGFVPQGCRSHSRLLRFPALA